MRTRLGLRLQVYIWQTRCCDFFLSCCQVVIEESPDPSRDTHILVTRVQTASPPHLWEGYHILRKLANAWTQKDSNWSSSPDLRVRCQANRHASSIGKHSQNLQWEHFWDATAERSRGWEHIWRAAWSCCPDGLEECQAFLQGFWWITFESRR
jgi:hypothetical protein